MGRKLFGGIPLGISDDPALETRKTADEPGEPPAFSGRSRARSAQALAGGILELTANSIRDLDPAVILADGPTDRLDIDLEAISALAESIRIHGQQVPILVRPSGTADRYRIVYGRRRLAAIRSLGPSFRVKAIVRSLEDDAAVIAQGQENNLRVDPSYIEKALFARALRDANYEPEVVQDALGIDRTAVSKMKTVTDNVPMQVIQHIGAAHDVGRPLWTELAQLARDEGVDLLGLLPSPATGPIASTGTERFEFILGRARERSRDAAAPRKDAAVQHSDVSPVTLANNDSAAGRRSLELGGRHIGTIRRTGRSISLSVSLRHNAQFGQWLEDHADDAVAQLHATWMKSQGEG